MPRKPSPARCPGCNSLSTRPHVAGCASIASADQVPLELGTITGCPHSKSEMPCESCRRLAGP